MTVIRVDVPEELLETVADLGGVSVETLSAFHLPPARTTFIADREHIFAKLVVSDATAERAGIEYAMRYGVATPALLAYAPRGNTELLILKQMTGTLERLLDPLSLMEQIWSLPGKPEFRPMDVAAKMTRGLNNLRELPPSHSEASAIRELYRALEAEYAAHAKRFNSVRSTWVHGDCHERNLLLHEGSPIALDFEWHGVGPRELDAGKWLQTNLSETDEPNPFIFWESLKNTDLDLDLVKFEVKSSAARAITYQLRWKTRLDWLPGLWSLARGENELFQQLA